MGSSYQNFNLVDQDITGLLGNFGDSTSVVNPTPIQPAMDFTQSLISGAASAGESILKSVFSAPNVPAGASYLTTTSPTGATTTELINNPNAGISTLGLGTSIMPLLLIGGIGLVLVMALSKH